MKSSVFTIVAASSVLALTNCTHPAGPNTRSGAAVGGVAGAALGGVVGHQSGRALEGAAIGAAAGAGTGAVIGNARDREQYGRY